MKKIIVFFLTALCLAGCGKRGKLDFPEGSTYPRMYPAPRQPKAVTTGLQRVTPEEAEEDSERMTDDPEEAEVTE